MVTVTGVGCFVASLSLLGWALYVRFFTKAIRDMGLVPGTKIKIQGRAPLYDPVALRVMGFTLTLRNSEADYIEVEVE